MHMWNIICEHLKKNNVINNHRPMKCKRDKKKMKALDNAVMDTICGHFEHTT